MGVIKACVRWLLIALYKVDVKGMEHYRAARGKVLIIANHTSFLDGVLFYAFFPEKLTFAVNTRTARAWWVRFGLVFVNFFTMDPTSPLSVKALVKYINEGRKAVIFPEGRITVTGSLMKIYQGPGLVADHTGALLLPVRFDGAQYTPFSRLRGRECLRWFPKITITIMPPRRIDVPAEMHGRVRRNEAGKVLFDTMTEMMFATSNYRRSLFESLLDARRIHGGDRVIIEDTRRQPVTYDELITRAFVLGEMFATHTARGERVGLLLPSMAGTVTAFLALHAHGRVPAMFNFTAGAQGMLSAAATAQIRTVYTSRRFAETAKLEDAVAALSEKVNVIYLEDIATQITPRIKIKGALAARWASGAFRRRTGGVDPDEPAVVLFTSGTEGAPKGVVLSHANLLANRAQLAARIDFGSQDVILNVLPLFHSFGLTAGTLLPLLSGIRTFFYPTPLHYRIIPEIAYDINATILFGTNTFLAGYARHAHPYDFYSLRYVFAGAEKLQDDTRAMWSEKFGLRIIEGYGATETSPVLAANTPMEYRAGSVGRLIPGVECAIEPVEGIAEGGRLHVRGPNIMLGYLLPGGDGEIVPPASSRGAGWYDTGDIVRIDEEGFIWILGRAKRFAKIGGEMISLAAVEMLASRAWPGAVHAVLAVPDAHKGEQLVLLTNHVDAARDVLSARAKTDGMSELNVPRRILIVREVPLLGSGKVDYGAARALVDKLLQEGERL